MTIYAIDWKQSRLRAFNSEQQVRSNGNCWSTFKSPEELITNPMYTSQRLVDTYNNCSTKKIKKFSDKETAARRVFGIAESLKPYEQKVEAEKKEYKSSVKRAKARKNKFAGKKINCLIDSNPRREGTRGWLNFNLFLKNPKMSYEEFIELAAEHGSTKGGCREDLAHDIKNGRVELV